MSGGQKQRLAIASILAMKPKVLVLDEPTSFLDPLGAERIFRVLDTLNKEYEMTILLIEHRVDLATQYVDRVIIFSDGQIANQGSPEEVFTDEATRLVGVGIPRVIELNDRLKSKGILLDRTPLNPTMLVEQLQDRIKRGNASRKAVDPDLDLYTGEQWVNPIIEIEGVSFGYPSVDKALDDVSLTIHKGEFVAIMGENGAGKTTLVKHLNGLLRPQEGRIKIDGADIADLSVANLARKVGLVFQNPDDQLFSENVEEEISFALRNFGFGSDVIDKRVDWAVNLLDLERYRKSSPFILSGGERKRVALGSVLAWDPEIVVLDEPTIGQDYAQKERLRHFLMQLRTQGKTIVIVTHDVEFVAECKPRIVLMADGKIIADGPIKKVMTDKEAMARASVTPPEITKVFQQLSEYGLPDNVIDVGEAVDILSQVLEAST